MEDIINGAKVVSLFCRIHMNAKKDLPIRSSEMGLLIYLVRENGSATPIKIAEFFNVSKPMVTAMINSLTNKGYLTKSPSQTDKRSFSLHPTEKAVVLVEKAYSEYYKTMGLLKKELGETDYRKLIALLDRANTILLEEKHNG
jgi:DNA-binding MarR family transcriptional regulator